MINTIATWKVNSQFLNSENILAALAIGNKSTIFLGTNVLDKATISERV